MVERRSQGGNNYHRPADAVSGRTNQTRFAENTEFQKNNLPLSDSQIAFGGKGTTVRYIDDLDGKKIPSTDLVNCLPDGTIQTVNSFKYPSREIKQRLGINFKYHYLRHTYGTLMAEMNTPTHLLCSQMGHGHIHITQRYYLAISQSGVETLQNNLKHL